MAFQGFAKLLYGGLRMAVCLACLSLFASGCSKKENKEVAEGVFLDEEGRIDQSRGAPAIEPEGLPDAPEDSSAKGMKAVAENDRYILYMDPGTTDIAVYDREAEMYTHSDPRRGNEGLSMDEVQFGAYGPLLEVHFSNLAGNAGSYSSYTDSVLLEQFRCYQLEDGVRIVYVLGLNEADRIIPPVLSEETYKSLLEELTDDEKADFRPMFRSLKAGSLPKEEAGTLVKTFPKLETENLYVLRGIARYDKDLLESILTAHGFTLEDVRAEMEYAGYEPEEESITFTVPIDITIDKEGMVATVDCKYIEEPEESKITDLNVLKGFAATDSEEGYILVPDGSGALFDLVSEDANTYSMCLYGADQAITAPVKDGYKMQSIMPVFGISDSRQAVFAVIEKGAAVSNVVMQSRSRLTPLACVQTQITVNEQDYQDYGSLKTNPSGLVLPADRPEAEVSIRYFLMNEENVQYSQMARLYQEYLEGRGLIRRQDGKEKTPFYVEMPGCAQIPDSVAGIPYTKDYPLTSYEDAKEILGMFLDRGVEGAKLRYTGWANDGLHNSVYDGIRFIGSLGSKGEFRELLDYAAQQGVEVFLDAKFDAVYEDKRFDGFQYSRDASRQLDHKVAVYGPYQPATLRQQKHGNYYVVSPGKLMQFATSFFKDWEKNKIVSGISLGTLGKALSSDYKVGSTLTREKAEECSREVFALAKEYGGALLVEAGNAYSWEYASDIVNLPTGGSERYSQREAVPFVQMVLHGYIDYAAMPLNQACDLNYEMLKAVETGSGLYVQMMYAEDIVLINTVYDTMLSFHYENQLEDVAEVYKKAAAALDQVSGEAIVMHEKLAEDVYATAYSNGKRIIVNYGARPYEQNGLTVQGESYAVTEVEE